MFIVKPRLSESVAMATLIFKASLSRKKAVCKSGKEWTLVFYFAELSSKLIS